MEKLAGAIALCARAYSTLCEILDRTPDTVVRDAANQRFEYTFETFWRLLKAYLLQREGIHCGSPKACFRKGLETGLLDAEETEHGLRICDDRNLTSHTYIEAIAAQIFSRLPTHRDLMGTVLSRIRERSA